MTEQERLTWPPTTFKGVVWMEPRPIPWTWIYGFIAYVLIFAIIGGLVLSLPAIAEGMR